MLCIVLSCHPAAALNIDTTLILSNLIILYDSLVIFNTLCVDHPGLDPWVCALFILCSSPWYNIMCPNMYLRAELKSASNSGMKSELSDLRILLFF